MKFKRFQVRHAKHSPSGALQPLNICRAIKFFVKDSQFKLITFALCVFTNNNERFKWKCG